MPSNVVAFANSKRHSTNAEKKARREAENSLKRGRVRLTMPESVKKDTFALGLWKRIIKDLKEIELLDNLDTDMLSVYCLGMSRLEALREKYTLAPFDETLKSIQAQERIMLSYAEKLGLTPMSRARLAVKRAGTKKADVNADLYGDD